MKNIALIPLRGGSKGIIKKNIKLLIGKPLCYYCINSAKKCSKIDEIWVSTDDDEIENICKKFNVKIHRRNPECGLDNSSTNSVIKDFIVNQNKLNDKIILIQATNPFTKTIDLTNCINKFDTNKYNLVIGVIKSHTFLWKESNGFITQINPNIRQRQIAEKEYQEDGSYYIFKSKDFIKNNFKIPNNKVGYNINTNNFHIEIDEPLDFELVKLLHKFLPK